MKFKDLLSIFFFGSLGSLSRYGLTLLFPGKQTTLLINIIGCFLLSFLTYYVIEHNLLSGWMNVGIGTGFIGAFTTFSSFCNDFDQAILTHNLLPASLYLLFSIFGGYLAAWLGFTVANHLFKRKEHQE
jgi:CrcB protein